MSSIDRYNTDPDYRRECIDKAKARNAQIPVEVRREYLRAWRAKRRALADELTMKLGSRVTPNELCIDPIKARSYSKNWTNRRYAEDPAVRERKSKKNAEYYARKKADPEYMAAVNARERARYAARKTKT